MAWTALTVVTQAGHKKRWNVLAAAGLRGLVRLLHVRAGFCCGVIRAHKKAIATLCFSPIHETHLFSKTLSPDPGLPHIPGCCPDGLMCPLPGMVGSWWLLGSLGLEFSCGADMASWLTDWALDPILCPTCSVALEFPGNLGPCSVSDLGGHCWPSG